MRNPFASLSWGKITFDTARHLVTGNVDGLKHVAVSASKEVAADTVAILAAGLTEAIVAPIPVVDFVAAPLVGFFVRRYVKRKLDEVFPPQRPKASVVQNSNDPAVPKV